MLKTLMMMDRKRMMHYTEPADYLKSNPLEAALPGFNRNGGTVEVQSVKTFWHFHRLRMGKQWDSLFEMLRDEVIAQDRALGPGISERCAEDGMPVAAMDGDGDASYNDHYEITDYRLDTIDDIDHGLPVAMKTVPGNVGDAPAAAGTGPFLHEADRNEGLMDGRGLRLV